jgi:MFS family permease
MTPRSNRYAVAVAAATQMLVVLDGAVLSVALPQLAADLRIETGALPWVINAYTLPFAGLLLLGGRVADLIGPGSSIRVGVSIFALASLAAGSSPNLTVLLISRALQGMGAALLSPASLALLTHSTSAGIERERAIAIWSVTASVGASSSALFGGVLTQLAGWRWVLLINVALAPALYFGTLRVGRKSVALEADTPRPPRGIDLPGTLLFLVAFGSADLAATGGGSSSVLRTGAAAALAVAALAGLVVVERRARHPLLPLHLLRRPEITFPNGAAVLLLAGTAAMGYYFSQYAQDVLLLSPFQTALTLLPGAMAGMLTASRVPALVRSFGERRVRTLGPAMAGISLALLAGAQSRHWGPWQLTLMLITMAIGGTISVVTLTAAATRSLPRSQAGLASGLISTSGQAGGSLGLALLTGVAGAVTGTATASTAMARSAAITSQLVIALPIGAGLVLLGALCAFRIPGRID